MSIFIKHPIVFTNKYSVAVRVNSSQCINVSGIYDKSPIESWIQMLKSFNYDDELKNYLIKFCLFKLDWFISDKKLLKKNL